MDSKKEIIHFQKHIYLNEKISGIIDCKIDISNLLDIQIIEITNPKEPFILDSSICPHIYQLTGFFQHEAISLLGMDFLTSLSVNNFFETIGEWRYEYFINSKPLGIKEYINIEELLLKEQEFVVDTIETSFLHEVHLGLQRKEYEYNFGTAPF